jgi:hypothetical protein
MEKFSAFISKLYPFDGAPLFPVDLLFMQKRMQLLRDTISEVPFFKSKVPKFFHSVQ